MQVTKITNAVLAQMSRAYRAHLRGKDLVPYGNLVQGLNKLDDAQFERVHRDATNGLYQ